MKQPLCPASAQPWYRHCIQKTTLSVPFFPSSCIYCPCAGSSGPCNRFIFV